MARAAKTALTATTHFAFIVAMSKWGALRDEFSITRAL